MALICIRKMICANLGQNVGYFDFRSSWIFSWFSVSKNRGSSLNRVVTVRFTCLQFTNIQSFDVTASELLPPPLNKLHVIPYEPYCRSDVVGGSGRRFRIWPPVLLYPRLFVPPNTNPKHSRSEFFSSAKLKRRW